jgi:hypothetical protein
LNFDADGKSLGRRARPAREIHAALEAVMHCRKIKIGDATAFICGPRPRVPKCCVCKKPSTKLCDFRLSAPEQLTHVRTCDAPLCDEHATRVGENIDYCPVHAASPGPRREVMT